MNRIILLLAFLYFVNYTSSNISTANNNKISLINNVYSMIVFKLQKYFPETKVSKIMRGKEINQIINRTRIGVKKKYILPNCTDVGIIKIKSKSRKMYNSIDKKEIPLSAKIEIFIYPKQLDAQANYRHMRKIPSWIEEGHNEMLYFIGNYSFRVVSLGPDNLINNLRIITANAIMQYIKIMRSIKK